MNRVNPLYVGVFLVFVLIMLSYKLSNVKNELQDAKDAYKETSKLATDLTSLKDVYNNKKSLQKSLQRVLSNPILKPALIQQDVKKNSTTIISLAMDIKALNFLMGKILNGTYNISSFKVKKLSDTKVSLDMEIKW